MCGTMKIRRVEAMLCALVLITQLVWTNASIEEAVGMLNQIRQAAPGNENIVPLTKYAAIPPKSWHKVKLLADDPQRGIEKLYNIYTKKQEVPVFDDKIEITRSDQTTEKYKLGRVIANGNQGSVHLGLTTIGPEKKVAVKQIKLSHEGSEEDAKEESRFYSRMKGVIDGVAVMSDCGTLVRDNETYFVMVLDFLDVEVFDIQVLCGEKFSLSTSVRLIRQLLKIVQELHYLGIVHRDLKAENVMISYQHGIRLVDFGYAQWYELDPKKRIITGRYFVEGTPYTMSTFTHLGLDPHPRDDLLSLWYMLAAFVDSELPWDYLLRQLVPGMSKLDERDVLKEIYNEKEKTSLTLLARYPELNPFIEHILGMPFDANLDYALLDGCLENVLNKYVINKNGKFDWEGKAEMLFCNPNVIHYSVAHNTVEKSYTLRFETFYASILEEIKQTHQNVQVVDELNQIAKEQIRQEVYQDGTYISNDKSLLDMQSLELADFQQLDRATLRGVGDLFIGFSYVCGVLLCHVVMVLKQNNEVWNILNEFQLPLPYQQSTWDSRKNTVDVCRYKITTVQLTEIPQNPLSVLENVLPKEIANKIERKEVADIGLKLDTIRTSTGYMQHICLVIRKSFDIAEYASSAGLKIKQNLSWSVDESGVPSDSSGPSSSANACNERIRFCVPNALWNKEEFTSFPESPNWKFARKSAVDNFLKDLAPDDQMLNVRVQWQNEGNRYKFTFLQDAYYKTFLIGENPANYGYGVNWLLGTRIVEGDCSLRQQANTVASEMEVRGDIGIEYRSGLVILSTTVDVGVFGTQAIFELMSRLRSTTAQKEAELSPATIGSVAFGYAVTGKYAYGVAIFETLAHTVLQLINKNRQRYHGFSQLLLSDQNTDWTKTTMERYNKPGLLTKSGQLLRSSAHIEKTLVTIPEIPAEVSVKGKNPISKSGSRLRSFSQQRGKSKTLLSYSSDSLKFNLEYGENGAYKFDLPSHKGVSIPQFIEQFWQGITPPYALISSAYKTISIAAFTGNKTIKIAYQLHKRTAENRICI